MNNKFAIIGLGRFGINVARTLAQSGAEVLAIDINEEKTNELRDDVAFPITLDASDMRALKAQNIHDVDAVVVAIGEDFESLLLCTANLMDLKIPRIIARAANPTQKMILEKMGIEEIISPEEFVGIGIANRLLNPSFISFIPLPDDYEIVEVKTPSNIANRTVSDIDLRKKYNINLITIKKETKTKQNGVEKIIYHVSGVPQPDTKLESTDILILMGKADNIKRLIDINK